jgi:hypothetical protein
MKDDQYRTSMEMMKSPLKDITGGRMKEETMSRLQARQGRKVKEEGKDKVEFLEPREHITNSEQDECMMKVICWLEGTMKIIRNKNTSSRMKHMNLLKWNMLYKFFFSVYYDKYDYAGMNLEDQ